MPQGESSEGHTLLPGLPFGACAFLIIFTMPTGSPSPGHVPAYPVTRLSQTRMVPSREAVESRSERKARSAARLPKNEQKRFERTLIKGIPGYASDGRLVTPQDAEAGLGRRVPKPDRAVATGGGLSDHGSERSVSCSKQSARNVGRCVPALRRRSAMRRPRSHCRARETLVGLDLRITDNSASVKFRPLEQLW